MRVVALLLVCSALAACGVSSKPAASTTPASTPSSSASTPSTPSSFASPPTASTPTASTPTVPSPASTPSTPATTSLRPVDLLPCTASKLTLSLLSSQGAAGHGVIALGLRNRSPRPCGTFGFPGIEFLTAAGGALSTNPTRVTTDFAGPVPERAITLKPGDSASFRLVLSHVSSGPAVCATAQTVQVIAPDDTVSLRTTLGQGTSVCEQATVSPLQPGLTANPA